MCYLAARLMEVPQLREVLEQVVPQGYPIPISRVYISHPSLMNNPDPFLDFNYYTVGAKVTYIAKDGLQEQCGSYLRISRLVDSLLEHAIEALGASMAETILAHEESKKPLPIRELTATDIEGLEVPF